MLSEGENAAENCKGCFGTKCCGFLGNSLKIVTFWQNESDQKLTIILFLLLNFVL